MLNGLDFAADGLRIDHMGALHILQGVETGGINFRCFCVEGVDIDFACGADFLGRADLEYGHVVFPKVRGMR